MPAPTSTQRAPVWFVAHGGPPSMEAYDHPAYHHWQKVGRDIRSANLKGIVFVSAHWQVEPEDVLNGGDGDMSRRVMINVDESNPMIYDFYGFHKHYYSIQFPTRNPAWLHESVSSELASQGYSVQKAKRGIDHGVWVPLYASFGKQGLMQGDADIPMVQVSLPMASTSPRQDGLAALRLGQALRNLRRQGIAVICGGQPVHNLRDYRAARMGTLEQNNESQSYGETFPLALTKAMVAIENGHSHDLDSEGDPVRWTDAKNLFARPDYRLAHPTSEHLLPALVALGAANDDEVGVEEFAKNEGALSWNMYRFG